MSDDVKYADNPEAFSERAVRKWRERKLVCPSGCPCIFPDDPDQFECACDGLCVSETWNDLRVLLEQGNSAEIADSGEHE